MVVDDGLFFVAVSGDKVIGTIMAGYDGRRGWIYSLAVHADHRRSGVATALVMRMERRLETLGCVKINLHLVPENGSAQTFYETLGYKVEPRISMSKHMLDE